MHAFFACSALERQNGVQGIASFQIPLSRGASPLGQKFYNIFKDGIAGDVHDHVHGYVTVDVHSPLQKSAEIHRTCGL